VVRGGGETRKKTAMAFALSFIIALMLAQPVSAGTMVVKVPDRTLDLFKFFYPATGEPKNGWGDNAPVVRAGYFDMVSFWLSYSQKEKTYTFGMKLAADLPQAGDSLAPGINSVSWLLYIDPEPWTPENWVTSMFIIRLAYDESNYFAELMDGGANVLAPLPFTVDGSVFQLEFSAASIGNPTTFWWEAGVSPVWGSGGYWMVDMVDPGASPGQVYWDIPWPPVRA